MSKPLAQSGSEMFERNIAVLGSKMREVRVRVSDEEDDLFGFVSGLDETTIQICRSDDMRFTYVNREDLILLEETGVDIHTLDQGDGFSDRLRKRLTTFANVCETHLERRNREKNK